MPSNSFSKFWLCLEQPAISSWLPLLKRVGVVSEHSFILVFVHLLMMHFDFVFDTEPAAHQKLFLSLKLHIYGVCNSLTFIVTRFAIKLLLNLSVDYQLELAEQILPVLVFLFKHVKFPLPEALDLSTLNLDLLLVLFKFCVGITEDLNHC